MAHELATPKSTLTDDEIFALIEEDDKRAEAMASHRLDQLFDNVRSEVQERLTAAANNMQGDTKGAFSKRYLKMNHILLSLQHWSHDIEVIGENPLVSLEDADNEPKSLSPILRTCFQEMLTTCSLLDETSDESNVVIMNRLETLTKQLQDFVGPLRVFLEDKHDTGDVGSVKSAAQAGGPPKPGKVKRKSTKKEASLGEKIRKCFVKSQFDSGDGHSFAPEGSIRDIVLPDVVRLAVGFGMEQIGDTDQDLIDFIVFKARYLFSICIRVKLRGEDLRSAMRLFMEKSVADGNLPFIHKEKDSDKDVEGPDSDDENGNSKSSSSSSELETSKLTEIDPGQQIWEYAPRHDFYDEQWRFLAPVFSTRDINVDLHRSCVLPFPEKGKEVSGGGFGQVSMISIHEKHIKNAGNMLGKLPKQYAIKQIFPNPKEHWKVIKNWTNELANLRAVTELKHRHILRFITAFRRGEGIMMEHYLICEWADGGNLRDAWSHQKNPQINRALIKAAITQMLGLADALDCIHYSQLEGKEGTLHGDLKPENILCFHDEGLLGTLKIGDWGLAKEKDIKTRDVKDASIYRASIKYEPPEMSEGVPVVGIETLVKTRSRLYDIWSMGCIFLEFIIWLVRGSRGLKALHDDIGNNQFWEVKGLAGASKPELRTSITRMIDGLRKEPACSDGTALGDLLTLVCTKLLAIPLPRNLAALDDNPTPGSKIRRSNTINRSRSSVGSGDLHSGVMEELTGSEVERDVDTQSVTESDKGSERSVMEPATESAVESVGQVAGPEQMPPAVPPITITRPDVEKSATYDPGEAQLITRARATDLLKSMQEILAKGTKSDSYWLPDALAVQPSIEGSAGKVTATPSDLLESAENSASSGVPSLVYTDSTRDPGSLATANTTPEVYVDTGRPLAVDKGKPPRESPTPGSLEVRGQQDKDLDGEWITNIDNGFAANVFKAIEKNHLGGRPTVRSTASLCQVCKALEVFRAAFKVQLDVRQLEDKAATCELCALFWKGFQKYGDSGKPTVSFARVGSWLRIGSTQIPSLFICRPPGPNIYADFQIGLPAVPEAASDAHFEIVRQWVKLCDTNHGHSTSEDYSDHSRLPTRLIDVGAKGDESVRLWETSRNDSGKYIALSHPWGDPPHTCTYTSNLADHKRGILVGSLPRTFQHAVQATRELGLSFLWIDSLCIIQGSDGDFSVEATRMERVFRGAYCVLAASCSLNHTDGFLRARYEPDYVTLSGDQGSYYVCEIIDDFNRQALHGNLNSRGWVLQEHALARRTIFFTEYQAYWECGDGVRCETGTKMNNSLAAFLGDTNFPNMIMSATKGERILRYQNLYRSYSQLRLSHAYDRPYAIAGLQTRLLRAFNTEGGFGVFDEGPVERGHLMRSLLWRRADDVERLDPITFPEDRALKVPSWSWMCYTGGIDYLNPEFNKTAWENIRSPWTRSGWGRSATTPLQPGGKMTLEGMAVNYKPDHDRDEEICIFFDRPEEIDSPELKCVVLGVNHGGTVSDKTVHVLVVKPSGVGDTSWVRVGAGYLPARCISSTTSVIVIC